MNSNIQTELNEDLIFSKLSDIFGKLEKNKQLQELAESNGLDVKNTVKLTDDSINNVAVSVVSLLIAKTSNDPRYRTLVNTGVQKRSLKTDIVNTYKNQANQLIQKYKQSLENK